MLGCVGIFSAHALYLEHSIHRKLMVCDRKTKNWEKLESADRNVKRFECGVYRAIRGNDLKVEGSKLLNKALTNFQNCAGFDRNSPSVYATVYRFCINCKNPIHYLFTLFFIIKHHLPFICKQLLRKYVALLCDFNENSFPAGTDLCRIVICYLYG